MSEKKKHYDDARLARAKAMGNWGREGDNLAAAMKSQGYESTVSGSLLEVVRRLNQAIRAWAADKDFNEYEYDPNRRPDHAKPRPGVKVGDVLYKCGELPEDPGNDYDPASAWVVVAVDGAGYARLVCLGGDVNRYDLSDLAWASDYYFSTPQEAVADQARSDVRYHGPRLRRCEAVLAALAAGADYRAAMKLEETEGADEPD